MNPVFATLAAVAFGLMMVGGDASAAHHKPAHHEPARKAAPPSRPVAKSASKSVAKVAPKATVVRGKAARSVVSTKAPTKTKVLSAREARASKTAHGAARAEKGRSGKPAQLVKEAPVNGRASKHHRGSRDEVQPERAGKKGRHQVEAAAPPVRETSRQVQKPVGREAFVPIGREAFVPSSPPVRQAAARQALVIPPPVQAPPVQPRLQAPAPQIATAAASAPVALRPTTELPKIAPRVLVPLAASSAGLSGAEAAAASAAAVSPAHAPEPVHVAPQPVIPTAPPVSAPPLASPVVQPAPAVQQPQSARPGRGLARAYAMDGATFYQSGRKIRVQGLDVKEPGMTSEHATQRLQRALDSGNLTVDPVEVDGSGHTLAVVRVNGRNVADTVRAAAN